MPKFLLLRAILLGLVLAVLGSGPASAHAALSGSDPEAGATLATAPTSITLTFNENIGNSQIAAFAPDGSEIAVSAVKAVDNAVTATLEDVDQKGDYSLSFRVVSADGHPVTGTIDYTVTTGRTVDQVEPEESEESQTFIHRHSAHLFWGILAAVVAIGLLLAPLRRRNDADRA